MAGLFSFAAGRAPSLSTGPSAFGLKRPSG